MSAFAMSEEELQQYATDYKAQVIAQRLESWILDIIHIHIQDLRT